MIQGSLDRDILIRGHRLVLFDDQNDRAYTLEIVEHELPGDFAPMPATEFGGAKKQQILHAIAKALQEIGMLPEAATTAELKATKYHLEDMRQLVHPKLSK